MDEKNIPVANANESEFRFEEEKEATAEKTEEKAPEKTKEEPTVKGYLMTYQALQDTVKTLQKEVQKAVEDLVKIMEGEIVYVHYRKSGVSLTVDRAYDKRDTLKQLGYKYNGIAKTWEKFVKFDEFDKEIEKLYEAGIEVVMPIGLDPERAKEEVQKAIEHGNKYRRKGGRGRGAKQYYQRKQRQEATAQKQMEAGI